MTTAFIMGHASPSAHHTYHSQHNHNHQGLPTLAQPLHGQASCPSSGSTVLVPAASSYGTLLLLPQRLLPAARLPLSLAPAGTV
mmetsp:Transcript_7103/g.15567  ORF Transcript_7103/g.15567 Transcript_7103/m.15567 type:complete len:84 (+) Transcript_7103:413-664(+)|eukprot:CAMPEP_0202904352 /NCGR_PEP_ID=MMETSP1392-20130828/28986_1 /ASSEMBLY_ACC=CAM_ASM_000868 /TAXON_ID=225041 /ORGANISM="Chlamydomonas chlamydogama, Strain SAG 11-48b" /LENGTH=83 /DNA_ID=CAMNT_0049591927 /DNA_START=336 /DNA_END=587 /DNA_ORIENTATION=+